MREHGEQRVKREEIKAVGRKRREGGRVGGEREGGRERGGKSEKREMWEE